jgi:hypothetical protein
MAESKLDVVMILEILGKPPEYLKEALSNLIDRLGKEPNVSLINKKIAEPKEIDKEHGIFSSFAEIEIAVNDMKTLIILLFNYMPSHVELINPESINIKNYDLNMLFNELTRRLHQYDEIAKVTMMEKKILLNQLRALQKARIEKKEENNSEEKKEIVKEKESVKKKKKVKKD